MIVKIAPMGERVIEVNIEPGATVADALNAAGVSLDGRSINIDGEAVTESTCIPENATYISLASKTKGGR